MKRPLWLPDKNKSQFVIVRLLESRVRSLIHKDNILNVFVKQDVKLIDELVKQVIFYAIQSITVHLIVKINNAV